jgi:hypothetical protein
MCLGDLGNKGVPVILKLRRGVDFGTLPPTTACNKNPTGAGLAKDYLTLFNPKKYSQYGRKRNVAVVTRRRLSLRRRNHQNAERHLKFTLGLPGRTHTDKATCALYVVRTRRCQRQAGNEFARACLLTGGK